MTEHDPRYDLRPKTNWVALIGVAITVGGAVWGVTAWMHSRVDESEVRELRNNATQVRLDQETIKGDVKAINIRIDSEFRSVNQKLDTINDSRRRR